MCLGAQLAQRRTFAVVSAVANRLSPTKQRRSIIRGSVAISVIIASAIWVVLLASPLPGFSQTLPVCQLPKNVVSISQASAAQVGAEIHLEKDPSNSKAVNGILHLYLRNDGPAQPGQLCAAAQLSDVKDVRHVVSMALSEPGENTSTMKFEDNISCFTIEPAWKAFQEMSFDLHLRADSALIPLSGAVNLNAYLTSQEKSTPVVAAKEAKTRGQASIPREPADSPHDCVSSSKPLNRSTMLLPAISSSCVDLPLAGAFVIALAYLLISLVALHKSLRKPVGGPQWNFATSFATNFTVGTGLLTPLLGASVMTDRLHYMTKFHYGLLAIMFAALLILAPAIFTFFSIPQQTTTSTGQTSTESVGSVWLFLATSALMICAVIGQLITVGFAIAEVRFQGYISFGPMVVIVVLLAVAGIGAIVSAGTTIWSYVGNGSEPTGVPTDHLRSIVDKFSSIPPDTALNSKVSDLFTDHERQTIENLVGVPKRGIRAWKMF
jgi:hypothetical protein